MSLLQLFLFILSIWIQFTFSFFPFLSFFTVILIDNYLFPFFPFCFRLYINYPPSHRQTSRVDKICTKVSSSEACVPSSYALPCLLAKRASLELKTEHLWGSLLSLSQFFFSFFLRSPYFQSCNVIGSYNVTKLFFPLWTRIINKLERFFLISLPT